MNSVRETTNHYSNGPVTDVTSDQIRCYELSGRPSASTYSVAAGSSVGFQSVPAVFHPGPIQVYMAKVPSGQTAASWNPSTSQVWFKIYTEKPSFSSSGITFASENQSQFSFKIPSSLPSGDYLIRIEHIALHTASSVGGAQFYISCGQLTVTGGGSGSPSPLVAFPGAYSSSDPGILINLYYPVPTSYTPPGPSVWSG
jgi:hypothetical protein